MIFRTSSSALALFAALATSMACGGKPRAQVPASTPPVPQGTTAVVSAAPAPDPVAELLARADAHFKAGERELALGHLVRARAEFDRAIDVLLESPGGARSTPRIREHYERLLDRVSAYETTAFAAGDGFTEKPSEPASIDELLATSAFLPPAPPVPDALKQAVTADLAHTAHDIPITLNERVLAYVELFQGRLRDWFESGLRRGSQYLPMIQQVFRAEGLPLDLAYIPLVESAFKPNAVSRAKAKGVWQFMQGTALENGLKHDWYIDERADPEKATLAAAKYLRTLHRMFGDWHLALASYNGGPGLVQRAMKRTGAADFWELRAAPRGALPRETREYVPMILAAIVIARSPMQYGFDIVAEAPPEFDTIALPRAVDLRRVAEWTGTSVNEIQALNPELRRWTTPVKRTDYQLKVPAGTGESLLARLEAAPPTDLTSLKWHTVKRGETVAALANRFKVSRADLASANGLSTNAKLRVGQEVLIPRAPAPLVASGSSDAPVRTASRTQVGTAGQRSAYRVQRGDTLYGIARQFGITLDDLRSWNRLRHDRITPGVTLAVRPPSASQVTQ